MANLNIDFINLINFIIVLFWIIYMFLNKLEHPKKPINNDNNCNGTCVMCCPTDENIQNYNQQIIDSESYKNSEK